MTINHDIHKTQGPGATRTEGLVNELADTVVRLKSHALDKPEKDIRWDKVMSDLSSIKTNLTRVKKGEATFEMNGRDFTAMLDTLEAVSTKAHAARKFSVLEIIGSILTLGIYAAVKAGINSSVVSRAEKLSDTVQTLKSHSDYNELREPSAKPAKPTGVTSLVTDDQAIEGVSNHILFNQQMVRNLGGRVDGMLVEGQQIAITKQGVDEPITPATLGGGAKVAESELGAIKLEMQALDGVIESDTRRDFSEDLVGLVNEDGTKLTLSNPLGKELGAKIIVERDDEGHLKQTVVHEQAARRTNLQFDRGSDIVPGDDRSFRDVALLLAQPGLDPAEFKKLNDTLLAAFEKDLEAKNIAPGLSFQQYKLQFLTFDVADVEQEKLRWHDGSGHLNAPEWVALDMRVADLPPKHQYYVHVKVEWEQTNPDTGAKEPKSFEMPMAMTKLPADDDQVKAVMKGFGWSDAKLNEPGFVTFTYDADPDAVLWEVPGKDEVQPTVRNLSLEQVRALLADEKGVVRDHDGKALDLTKEEDLTKARDLAMGMMRRTVNTQMYRGMGEYVSGAIKDLMDPHMPHTQKVFFRQSNGVANFDEVNGVEIGQTHVIQDQNDTGAFGKCAPISYFSSSICAIGVGARKGFDTLIGEPSTKAKAEQLQELLTRGVLNKDARALVKELVQDLDTATNGKPERAAFAAVKQLVTSVVDRLNLQVDDEGPYFEMSFFYPTGLDRGAVTVKVRPQDIQQYLETTSRGDVYRDGKQHMMDFFKDPTSMHQIDLMRGMGVGAIAVGVDKALKTLQHAPKSSGLLFGPYNGIVEAMVYGKDVTSKYTSLTHPPMTKKPGDVGYDVDHTKRRDDLLVSLKRARDTDGPISVSMGYSSANGHVNYVQAWGTPYLCGVAIDPVDLARCHMNDDENSATTSAWRNDRSAGVIIDLERMAVGLKAIFDALPDGDEKDEIEAMLDDVKTLQPDDLTDVRWISARVMRFLTNNVTIENDDARLVPDKVVVFSSNTERDNYLSDNVGDRFRVGGGAIGDQRYGSANAADGGYFVPLDMLCSGWNGVNELATGYVHADPKDHFIMLSSINIGEIA